MSCSSPAFWCASRTPPRSAPGEAASFQRCFPAARRPTPCSSSAGWPIRITCSKCRPSRPCNVIPGPSESEEPGMTAPSHRLRHVVHQVAQIASPRRAEGTLEARLRARPGRECRGEARGAGAGETELLAAPVGFAAPDRDQTVALQRQNIAAERGAAHHQIGGQRIDGHWPLPFELRQDRILRGAQAAWTEEAVVKLRYLARRLPQCQTIANRG